MERIIFALGIIVIISSLTLATIFPAKVAWMPEGFNLPIVAFEFLQTDQEVLQFFGEDEALKGQIISAMNAGHKIDNIYLVLYSLFLCLWGWYSFRQTSNKIFFLVILFAILAAIGDVVENRQLVEITNKLQTKHFGPELKKLLTFTWLKWGSLALALASLSPYTFQQNKFGKAIAAISILTLVLGVMAFFNRSAVTTYFSLGISVQFLCLVILAGLKVFGKRKINH